MSYGQEYNEKLAYSRDCILSAITQARDRAELGKQNAATLKKIDEELAAYESVKKAITECTNYLVRIYKNVEQYTKDRREIAMDMIKCAISKAGYIVPDAGANGIKLDIENGSAMIVNETGQDINEREGSGYRTVLGSLIRYTIIKANPDAIQALFFDEGHSTLDMNASSTFREYIDVFKEDCLVVVIEQRDVLFQGLDKTVYKVTKTDGVSTVVKICDASGVSKTKGESNGDNNSQREDEYTVLD